jgi:hypothetical protein
MDLKTLQEKIRNWNGEKFPTAPSYLALIKFYEEAGELARHYVGRVEHRVGKTEVDHQAGIEDAVGDIVIALTVFCERERIDLATMVEIVWSEVSKRTFVMKEKHG